MLRAMGLPVWLTYPLADLAMRVQVGVWMEQVSPENAVASLGNTPLFVLHGTKDTEVSVDQAENMCAESCAFWINTWRLAVPLD